MGIEALCRAVKSSEQESGEGRARGRETKEDAER